MAATADPPRSHNITAILAEDPRFSTFNHHLTTTGLAKVINSLPKVTVCAMDNAAMLELLSLNPSRTSLLRVLLFHLFSHYFDSGCAWTLYPCAYSASNEYVDQELRDGEIFFTYPYTTARSQLLGYVKMIPPHLSVLHVSTVLPSPEAWSLMSPIHTLKIMAEVGCGAFAGAIAGVAAAERRIRENAYVGLTVFCPVDAAWERFEPKFKALSEEKKADLLLFHAIPGHTRRSQLVEQIEDWRPATMATTVASFYRGNGRFGEPRVKMGVVRKLMAGDGYDEEDGGPLTVLPIRGVMLPDDPVGFTECLDPVLEAVEMEQDRVEFSFELSPSDYRNPMVLALLAASEAEDVMRFIGGSRYSIKPWRLEADVQMMELLQ